MFYRTLLASDLARASDEDLCSQLNHVWSALLLTAMGLLISMVQYVGDPIHCLCPASMPEVHCNYTKALCWVKESYYTDDDDKASLIQVTKSESRIAYYPWAPWILFCMAACLKLPHFVWHSFAPQSDLNLSKLVLLADLEGDIPNLATVIRVWLIRTKRRYRDIFHRVKRVLSLLGFFWFGRHKRTFLTGLIMCVKVMYLVISITLFFSLNIFLDENFTTYGWEVIQDFLHGLPQITPKFPKQIICNIKIRQLSNVNRFSIQCILPINLYNQKIFLFLWFWFIFLTIMNGYSLIKWGYKLLSPYQRWKFVHGYVQILSHLEKKAKEKKKRKKRRKPRKDRDHNGNAILIDTAQNRSNSITLTRPIRIDTTAIHDRGKNGGVIYLGEERQGLLESNTDGNEEEANSNPDRNESDVNSSNPERNGDSNSNPDSNETSPNQNSNPSDNEDSNTTSTNNDDNNTYINNNNNNSNNTGGLRQRGATVVTPPSPTPASPTTTPTSTTTTTRNAVRFAPMPTPTRPQPPPQTPANAHHHGAPAAAAASAEGVVRLRKTAKKRGVTFLSSIEMGEGEFHEAIAKRNVHVATAWMLSKLGHDGVLVFRTLESAVGIVLANQIFHELHNQIMAGVHHSET